MITIYIQTYILFLNFRTPIGDRIERQAIEQLFGTAEKKIFLSSTKGHTGHLLGGAGALESIFTILACNDSICPGTLNFQASDEDFDHLRSSIQIIGHQQHIPWKDHKRIALKNSFGFGGTNSCLVFSNLF